MTGYSFKADANDDNQPRNRNLTFVTNNILLSNNANDKILCPNAKRDTICGSYQVVNIDQIEFKSV